MENIHPSFLRLIDALHRAGVVPKEWEPRHAKIAMNESPATITNWQKRGVSRDGATYAQGEYGINLNWVLTGSGNMTIGGSHQAGGGWPFRRIPRDRYMQVSQSDRDFIEGKVSAMVDDFLGSAKKEPPIVRKSSNGG